MATTEGTQEPEALRRFIDHHVAFLRGAKEIGDASQKHNDQMLTWSIGLMGAGIFSSLPHLPVHASSILALAPWILGILVAITARLVGQVVRDRDRLLQFDKSQSLLLLMLAPPNKPGLADSVKEIVYNKGELKERFRKLKRLNCWTEGLGWAAHILLGLGVVTVAACWALGR